MVKMGVTYQLLSQGKAPIKKSAAVPAINYILLISYFVESTPKYNAPRSDIYLYSHSGGNAESLLQKYQAKYFLPFRFQILKSEGTVSLSNSQKVNCCTISKAPPRRSYNKSKPNSTNFYVNQRPALQIDSEKHHSACEAATQHILMQLSMIDRGVFTICLAKACKHFSIIFNLIHLEPCTIRKSHSS
uniref:Uncharacterized protein n=1 Tax=Romanomermis culicivorax TaxID=13658 RepID=A0A915KX11_ROMCU